MNPLKISVIGCGYWGRKVIREIIGMGQNGGNMQLHTMVDNFPTSLAQSRLEFGSGFNYETDYHSLATDPSVNAVHICTPNSSHFEIAATFLSHGKHVVVEKPLSLKTKEAYELVRLARENNRVLCVGHVHRFNNGVRELRRVIDSGRLGELYYANLRWTGHMVPQFQREVITDLAPHPFDICNSIFDMWPERIVCKGRGYRTSQNEEMAHITAEYVTGLLAHIEVSWLDYRKRRQVVVVGSKGMAILDCVKQKLILQYSDETQEIPVIPSNTIGDLIAHFAECIRKNQYSNTFSNLADGLLGARVVSLLEASRDSMDQDRTVTIPPVLLEAIIAR